MKTTRTNTANRDLRTLFGAGTIGTLSDGQLLERFLARRDEAAFEALVLRHGPMVWGVCRRVLRKHHDAEDAFQATFLVLARKASSVLPREMVANWLYGVACQTALKARTTTARRQAREKQMIQLPEPEAASQDHPDELMPLLDRELSRLPDRYRIPIILCDLEGKTHKEASGRLGWPIGTLSGRLSRGRALLAKRLSRRGPTLSVGSLAALLSHRGSLAGVPASLVSSTIKAAASFAAGRAGTAGLISARVAMLTEGVLKAAFLTRVTSATGVLMLIFAAGGLTYRTQASGPASIPIGIESKSHGRAGRPPFPGWAVKETKVVMDEQEGKKATRDEMDARRTAEAFSAAISDQRLKDAARLCWPEQYDEGKLQRLKEALGRNRLTVDSVDTSGDVALTLSGKVRLKAEDGRDGDPEVEARLLLVLCKKDGAWQVQVIDLGPADRTERDRKRFRTQFPEPEHVRRR